MSDSLLPNLRDGLTSRERVVLTCLRKAKAEVGNRSLKTATI